MVDTARIRACLDGDDFDGDLDVVLVLCAEVDRLHAENATLKSALSAYSGKELG